MRALSARPGSGKSVAWSDDVVDNEEPDTETLSIVSEEGPNAAMDEETEAFSKELEEELNRDQTVVGDKDAQMNGCWSQFTAMVSSE